jgi:ATP-binding cassette subfamily B protein
LELSWRLDSADRLMAILARHAARTRRAVSIPPPAPAALQSIEAFDAWLSAAASSAGSDATAHAIAYADVDALLGRNLPIILRLRIGQEDRLLAVIGGRTNVTIVTADGGRGRMSRAELTALLRVEIDRAYSPTIDLFLSGSGLSSNKACRARASLLLAHAGNRLVGEAWLLHQLPAKSFWGELWRSGVPIQAVVYVGAFLLHYLVVLWAWAVVGLWALGNSVSMGRFTQWALLLASTIALFVYGRWTEGIISVRINALIKERLLAGALKIDRDRLRSEGPSHLLSRVLESNTIQTVMLEGVFGAAVATIESVFAAVVLQLGAVGWPHTLVFALWVFALGTAHSIGYLRRAAATDERVRLTHDLVEKMVGYRTRLAQQPSSAWHDGEDEALCHYQAAARRVDDSGTTVEMIAARGWIIAATAMLLPSILAGARPVELAISIGGILLAESALLRYLPAGTALAEGFVAWRNVRDILRIAQQPEKRGAAVSVDAAVPGEAAVIVMDDVWFRHAGRTTASISGCHLTIRRGDRVLVQGPSGSGKTTLCALIAGMRKPDSGVILLHGLDQVTVGEQEWRRRVAATLQFHENHVFTESFAFNLLMGRNWPPMVDDLREARAICNELGLGDLLNRMPAGMFQIVGEYGWQLSHGERSRLFIARSLLQRGDLIILDESFAALDPGAFGQSLECVLRRAPSLIVVAHP